MFRALPFVLVLLCLLTHATNARDLVHPHLHRAGAGIVPLSTTQPGEAWCVGPADLFDAAAADPAATLDAPLVVTLRLPHASCPRQALQAALPDSTVEHLGTGSLLVGMPSGTQRAAVAAALRSPPLQHVVAQACLLPAANKHRLPAGDVAISGVALAQHACLVVMTLAVTPEGLSPAQLLRDYPAVALAVEPVPGAGVGLCCRTADAAACVAPPPLLYALLHHPGVYYLEHQTRPTLHAKFSRGILQSHTEFAEPFSDAGSDSLGLTGAGYIVGVADTGIDTDHCFFHDPQHGIPYNTFNGEHRKIVRYTTIDDSGNAKSDYVPGHGTHVCGTLAGSMLDPAAAPDVAAYHGVAPGAKITFSDLSGPDPEAIQGPSIEDILDTARQDGARVHSNSWGSELALYTSTCSMLDEYISAHSDILVVFSAGNSADARCGGEAALNPTCDRRSVTSPSTAKNVISVGASQATLRSWQAAALGNYVLTASGSNGATLRFNVSRANFGPKATPVAAGTPARFAADAVGCKAPSDSMAGSLVVAQRGTCHFSDKSIAVQGHQAAGLLVLNNIPGDAITMGCGIEGDTDCGVTIPSFMASQTDGAALLALMGKGPTTVEIRETSEASLHKNEENLSFFSSHGPTEDFRYKPDLVGIGELVHNAMSDGDLESRNCGLWTTQGTSMAAPMVAGLAILLHEYFEKGMHARGAASPGDAVRPSSALVKAALLHAAEPLTGLFDRNSQGDWRQLPDHVSFEQGHGRPVLNGSFPHSMSSPIQVDVVDNHVLQAGQVDTYCVRYNGLAAAFKATLVWHDPRSSPIAAFHLVNNLDLTVRVDASGDEFHGNILGPNTSVFDVLNNAEKVRLPKAPAGVYRVSVAGTLVAGAGQLYALVVSGKLLNASTCPPFSVVCAHGTANAAQSGCQCEKGWYGPACAMPVPTLSAGEAAVAVVAPAEWAYFRIHAAPTESLTVTIAIAAVDADVDVLVCKDRFPTLADRENTRQQDCVRETTCDNCSPRKGPAVHSVSLSQASVYFVGLVGMCCYPSNVTVSVAGKTSTASVARQQIVLEHSAVAAVPLTLQGSSLAGVSTLALLHSRTGATLATCPVAAPAERTVTAMCPAFACSADLARQGPMRLALYPAYADHSATAYPDPSVASVMCTESYFPATPNPLGTFQVKGLSTCEAQGSVTPFLLLPPTALLNTTLWLDLVGTDGSSPQAVVTVDVIANRTRERLGPCTIVPASPPNVLRCTIDPRLMLAGDLYVLAVNGQRAAEAAAAFAIAPAPAVYAIATGNSSNVSSSALTFDAALALSFVDAQHVNAFSFLGRGFLPSVVDIFPTPAAWMPLAPAWQTFTASLSLSLLAEVPGGSGDAVVVRCTSLLIRSEADASCAAGPFPTSGRYTVRLHHLLAPSGVAQAALLTVAPAPVLTGLQSTFTADDAEFETTVAMSGDLSITLLGSHFPIDGAVSVAARAATAAPEGVDVLGSIAYRDGHWLIASFASARALLAAANYTLAVRFGDYALPSAGFAFSFDGVVSLVTGIALCDDVPTTDTVLSGVALNPARPCLSYLYGAHLDRMVDPLVLVATGDGDSLLVQASVLDIAPTKVTILLPPFLSGDVSVSFYFAREAYVAVPSTGPVTLHMSNRSAMRRPTATVSNMLLVGTSVQITTDSSSSDWGDGGVPSGGDGPFLFLTNRSECYLDPSEGEAFATVTTTASTRDDGGSSFTVSLTGATTHSTIACLCDRVVDTHCFWRRAELPLVPSAIVAPTHLTVLQDPAAVLDDVAVAPDWYARPPQTNVIFDRSFTVNITLSDFPVYIGPNDGTSPFYMFLAFDRGSNATHCDPSTTLPLGMADDVDDTNMHFGFGDVEVPSTLRRLAQVKLCVGVLIGQMAPNLVDRRIFIPLVVLRAATCRDSADCASHGDCVDGSCRCAKMFRGATCDTACPVNWEGVACSGQPCDRDGRCLCGDTLTGPSCDQQLVRWRNVTFGSFASAAEVTLSAQPVHFAFPLIGTGSAAPLNPAAAAAGFVDVLVCRIDGDVDPQSPPVKLEIVSAIDGDTSGPGGAPTERQRLIAAFGSLICTQVAFDTKGATSSSASFLVAFRPLAPSTPSAPTVVGTLRIAFALRASTVTVPTSNTQALASGMMTRSEATVVETTCAVFSSCGIFFVLVFLASACFTVAIAGVMHALIVGRSLF